MRALAFAALLALSASLVTTTADSQTAKPRAKPKAKPFNPGPMYPNQFRAPRNEITQVKGDLWRAGDGNWFVAFLVTPDGILLIDTLNPPFAKWLKAQLAERFPGKPVKYVIYSHTHWDHIDGSNVFADTATYIAQENALKNLDGRYPHMPGDMVDRNNNGKMDPDEFGDPFLYHLWLCGGFPSSVTDKDKDGDGLASPAEFLSDIHQPDLVYSERMTLRFGGKTLELIFPGKNHANDGTAVLFHDERVLFTADFPADVLVQETMRSLPSGCGPFDGHPFPEWIKSYRTLEALDFDELLGGHGWRTFRKQDITEGREYFQYLEHEVSTAMSKGMSLEEMKKTLMLEPYKDWKYYDISRAMNIEAMYLNLKNYK
jgi:glyoxylase-like metal-dependent hydrolase (beta-lactamase superfamily II)